MQWKSLMTMAESRRGTVFKYSNKLDLFLLNSVHFKTMTWYYSAFYTWRLDRYTAKRVFQYFNRARKSRAEFTYYSSAVINCYRDDTDQRLIYWRFKDRETWDLTLRWARWTGGCDARKLSKHKKKKKRERHKQKKKSLQKNYNEVQRRPRVDIHGMATDTFREWWGIKTKWQKEPIYNDGDWWRLLAAAVRNVEMWRSDRVDSSFKGEKKGGSRFKKKKKKPFNAHSPRRPRRADGGKV